MSDINVDVILKVMYSQGDVDACVDTLLRDNPKVKGVRFVENGNEFPEVVIEYAVSDKRTIDYDGITGRHFYR